MVHAPKARGRHKGGESIPRRLSLPNLWQTVWMYMPNEAPYLHYVAAESLPVPPQPVFAIYEGYNVNLAVDPATRARPCPNP